VRTQVRGMTQFKRGEGIWFDAGVVYLATTNDSRIHAYDTRTERIELLYDAAALKNPPLTNVDNVTVSRSGDLFVCEDTSDSDDPGLDIGIITPQREVARFLKLTGNMHIVAGEARSEIAGVIFDPSGTRMFFASQRGLGTGIIYEVTGPFRQERPPSLRPRGFRVHVPRSVMKKTLLKRGLPFAVVTGKDLEVTARLTARLDGRDVTLARVHEKLDGPGRDKLRLRPRRLSRRLTRRRRTLRAKVTITATDGALRRRVIERPVRVVLRKKR
jgi:secreted PhoX family phosphatase